MITWVTWATGDHSFNHVKIFLGVLGGCLGSLFVFLNLKLVRFKDWLEKFSCNPRFVKLLKGKGFKYSSLEFLDNELGGASVFWSLAPRKFSNECGRFSRKTLKRLKKNDDVNRPATIR